MNVIRLPGAEPTEIDEYECYAPNSYMSDEEYEERLSSMIWDESVQISLKLIMELLRPALQSSSHDDAMIALALSSPARFVDPLSNHEIIVLACALYMENLGRATDYNDVLDLTQRFSGRAMNTTMVYSTFRALTARGLVEERGRELDEATERLSRTFAINASGKEAFRLAVVNANQLQEFKRSVAA